MRKIEQAMLSSMKDTEMERRARAAAYAVATVNFLAPVFVAIVMGTPILLHGAEVISDFRTAATLRASLASASSLPQDITWEP